MMELAQTYKLIYGSTPKRDCIRGDRYGPADRWIETVMRIAGRRAEDRLQPAGKSIPFLMVACVLLAIA